MVSLAGRYLVLMPNNPRGGGVSRRVEGEEREELKENLDQLEYPKGMSLIARTAGIGRTAPELQWDLNYMLKLWDAIDGASKAGKGAFLIYQESSLVIRAIRDYFTSDVGEILIDTDDIYEQAQQFMAHVMPEMASKVKRYRDDAPLFSRFQIEHQIETAFSRTVNLPSGGAIVIDHTEALVSVDVNSARSTRGSDIEETATRTNLEAADEIARQMRLRDLGGLIVVDFIDMDESKNRREVETRLREALRPDRARVQVSAISKFGLLELSRQRLRPALSEGSHITCPRCNGTGHIRDTESSALQILRMVQEESMRENTAAVHVQVPVEVTSFLLNEKRTEITKIELKQRVTVLLVPNKNLDTPNYRLERLRHDDPRLENLQASYTMIEEASEETGVTRREKTAPKQEPVVKGIMPETPAPAPVPRPASPPVASVAVPAPAPAATGGFFGWLGRLFGGGAAAPAAAPVVASGASPSPADSGRGDRNGRGGRGGRGGRDGKRPERTGETRPEGRGGERRDARPGRGARTDEMVATDTGVVREERPARSEATAEAGDENRRSRGGRGGRGRGDRAERDVRAAEPAVDDNGLPIPEADAEGPLSASGVEGSEQTAEGAEGSESGEGKTRRRRRGGRGGRDRSAARPVDGDGELAADLPVTGDDESDVQTASPAEAGEVGEAGERDARRRGGRGRGRGDRGEARTDGEAAIDSAAEPVVSALGEQASDTGTIQAPRPATSIVAAEVVDAVAEFIPAQAAQAAPVEQAEAEPEASVIVAPTVMVAVAEPVVQPAPAPVVIAAPAVVEPVVASAAAPFVLETTALAAVAESAGLQWVNSDADKMRSAQEAMANEPKPVHVARAIKPAAVIDEGPLMLVETRKDLSQVTLPFESEAGKSST